MDGLRVGRRHFHSASRVLSRTPPEAPPLYQNRMGSDVNIAAEAYVAIDVMPEDEVSWQDVYRAYGCSLDMDADDDGG